MISEVDELWTRVATLIRSERGWSRRPLAQLSRSRADRCAWLAEGEPGTVIVKLSANRFAFERAAWTAEALALLRVRGMPAPVPLWWGRLDVRWWALLQPRLPGEHVDAVDVSLLEELLALVELQAEPVLGPGRLGCLLVGRHRGVRGLGGLVGARGEGGTRDGAATARLRLAAAEARARVLRDGGRW
jgi:hypothetical protein